MDVLQDDRQADTVVHQRKERRFLGSFQLPFSTVFENERIDGSFQLEVPKVLFGYQRAPKQSPDARGHEGAITTEKSTESYLSLFVTLDPPMPKVPEQLINFETTEDIALVNRATAWTDSLRQAFPGRSVRATAPDINGLTVLVTRYIHHQYPPADLVKCESPEDVRLTMRRLARLVSLVPHQSDTSLLGNGDMWTTSDQFLHMLSGDEEEHAILLCNMFLGLAKMPEGRALDIESWCVLGHAVPEGRTSYVLTRHDGDQLLWNPASGRSHRLHDNHCPLQRVGCVFNSENVWANVQRHSAPAMISWDLGQTKAWRPLFTPKDPAPVLGTVQVELLHFPAVNVRAIEHAEQVIETTLCRSMENWRPRFVTRWNRHCVKEVGTPSLQARFAAW